MGTFVFSVQMTISARDKAIAFKKLMRALNGSKSHVDGLTVSQEIKSDKGITYLNPDLDDDKLLAIRDHGVAVRFTAPVKHTSKNELAKILEEMSEGLHVASQQVAKGLT